MASETQQISATVKTETAQNVSRLAQEANRSFSQMVEILLKEAIEKRNLGS